MQQLFPLATIHRLAAEIIVVAVEIHSKRLIEAFHHALPMLFLALGGADNLEFFLKLWLDLVVERPARRLLRRWPGQARKIVAIQAT